MGRSVAPRGVCRVQSLPLSRGRPSRRPGRARPAPHQAPGPVSGSFRKYRGCKARTSRRILCPPVLTTPLGHQLFATASVRHCQRGSQRCHRTAVSASQVRSRPWPRTRGFGEGSKVTQESQAPHWHRPCCGRRQRLGLQPREGGGGACPGVTPRRRKGGPPAAGGGCDGPARAGGPISPAPAEGRGREIPSRVQNRGQEKSGGPLTARAWETDA